MPAERDWIATELNDTRFYEFTNNLLTVAGKWLSLANVIMFVGLMLLVFFMPLKNAYYITSQNGELKPIFAISKKEIKARVAADIMNNKSIKHQ